MNAPEEKPEPKFFRVGSSLVKDGAVKAMAAVDLKVYMVLALHANWTTGQCWPSYKTIRDLTGCSRGSIADAIRRLELLGTISHRKEKAHNGRRNVYSVFRTLRPSSEGQSSRMDYPPSGRKRDKSGRFQSSRMDDAQSSTTDDLQSSGVDQNEIYLNESNRKRSKEPASETSARHSFIISENTVKELLKVKSKEQICEMLRQRNYPIPRFLFGEEETVSPEVQAHDHQVTPDQKKKEEEC